VHKSKKKQYLNDVVILIILITLYNLSMSMIYDTLQYMNFRKVLWAFIAGFIAFVPMYTITWLSLRKMSSSLLFILISFSVWLLYPILMSQGHSETFNAWQGGKQIYVDGELTRYGYVHKLQNPFVVIVLYSLGMQIFRIFRNSLR